MGDWTQSRRISMAETQCQIKETILRCFQKHMEKSTHTSPFSVSNPYSVGCWKDDVVGYDIIDGSGEPIMTYTFHSKFIHAHERGHHQFKAHSNNFTTPSYLDAYSFETWGKLPIEF